jgi:ribosomal protein S18 acetylase RimI-like enzyme
MIEIVTSVSDDLVDALNGLIPQLSSSAEPLTTDSVSRVVASAGNSLLIARHEGRIVGTLTLVCFEIPTGTRAWIEDVVVDESARGLGMGDALVAAAIERALELGARNIDLTSRSSRVAAHRLYERAGFEVRETNVYRLKLS